MHAALFVLIISSIYKHLRQVCYQQGTGGRAVQLIEKQISILAPNDYEKIKAERFGKII